MQPQIIIPTKLSDLDFVGWLLEEAIVYQKKNGYSLWTNFDMDVIRNEIKSNSQYKILIENEIACVFSVVYSDKVIWMEREIGDALYLHRILVNPNHKGKRLFGEILKWSISEANNKNLAYIRMDTWGDNPSIITYYKTFGFQFICAITTSRRSRTRPSILE